MSNSRVKLEVRLTFFYLCLCHCRGYKSYVFSWYEDMGVEVVLTEDDETIVDNDGEHTSNI